jgi:hypothetical protein
VPSLSIQHWNHSRGHTNYIRVYWTR